MARVGGFLVGLSIVWMVMVSFVGFYGPLLPQPIIDLACPPNSTLRTGGRRTGLICVDANGNDIPDVEPFLLLFFVPFGISMAMFLVGSVVLVVGINRQRSGNQRKRKTNDQADI
jgi:hypothetical protein